MKNILFGLAVGVIVGYILRRVGDQGQFECLENELHGPTDEARRGVKGVVDASKNQVEYVKDRVEHMVEKPKSNQSTSLLLGREKETITKKVNDGFFFSF